MKTALLAFFALAAVAFADPSIPPRPPKVNATTNALVEPTAAQFRSANSIQQQSGVLDHLAGNTGTVNLDGISLSLGNVFGGSFLAVDETAVFDVSARTLYANDGSPVMNFTDSGYIGLWNDNATLSSDGSATFAYVSAAGFSGDGASLYNLTASSFASGTLAVARGGTNLGSYAVGDILYASGTGTLAKLADVATGSVLVSGGVSTAPSYSSTPTIGGNITANGTNNTAPNHAAQASSASTLLTRTQSLWEELFNIGRLRHMQSAWVALGISGTGSVYSTTSGRLAITPGTAGSGYAYADLFNELNEATDYSGQGTNFSNKMALAVRCNCYVNAGGSNPGVFRFIVGTAAGSSLALANANAISTKGFGVEIYDSSGAKARIFAHDGTTYRTSTAISITGVQTQAFVVTSDGAGNLALYFSQANSNSPGRPSSTATVTMTGGPTGAGASVGASDFVKFTVVNSSAGAPTNQLSGYLFDASFYCEQ